MFPILTFEVTIVVAQSFVLIVVVVVRTNFLVSMFDLCSCPTVRIHVVPHHVIGSTLVTDHVRRFVAEVVVVRDIPSFAQDTGEPVHVVIVETLQ